MGPFRPAVKTSWQRKYHLLGNEADTCEMSTPHSSYMAGTVTSRHHIPLQNVAGYVEEAKETHAFKSHADTDL